MTPRLPSFAIVLTTYRRPALVLRSVRSVIAQSHPSWTLVLVNDSPDEDYSELESLIAGEVRVSYLKNKENVGKNTSVNRAFDLLRDQGFEGYVVFLDDDDWLAPECLPTFATAIEAYENPWLVSARAREDGTPFTKNRTNSNIIRYYRDVLLSRRFSGDATHCIRFGGLSGVRFPNTVKNAEEWFFFAQVAQRSPSFHYIDAIGTFSEGYLHDGLTRVRFSIREKLGRYRALMRDISGQNLWNPSVLTYMILRFGKLFL